MDRAHQNGVNISQALDIFRQNAVVPGDQYLANQAQIEEARAVIDSLEARNRAGYRRFMEQELRQRVQEGEEAKRLLASLDGNGVPTPVFQHPSSSPAFESSVTPAGFHKSDGQDILPSSARIVEIPASQRTSPPITRSIGSSSSSRHYSPNVISNSSHATQPGHPYSLGTQSFGYEPSPRTSHSGSQAAPQLGHQAMNSYAGSNTPMFSEFSTSTSNFQQTQPQQPPQPQSSNASYYRHPTSLPQATTSFGQSRTDQAQAVYLQPYASNQSGQNQATYQTSAPITMSSSLDGALGKPEHSSVNPRTYARKTSPSRAPNAAGDSRLVSEQNLPTPESHVTKEMLLQRAQQLGRTEGTVPDQKLTKEMLFKSAAHIHQQYGTDFTRKFLQDALASLNEGQASKSNSAAGKTSERTPSSLASVQATSQPSTSAQPIFQTTSQDKSTDADRTQESTNTNMSRPTQQAVPSQSFDSAHTFTNIPISVTSRASRQRVTPSESEPPREARPQNQAQTKPMNQAPAELQAQIQAEIQAQAQMQAHVRAQLEAQTRTQIQAPIPTQHRVSVPAATSSIPPVFHVPTSGPTAYNATTPQQGYYSRTSVPGSKPVFTNPHSQNDQVYWVPTPAPVTIFAPAQPYAPYGFQVRQYQPPVSNPASNPVAQAINNVKAATQARGQPTPASANTVKLTPSSSTSLPVTIDIPPSTPVRTDSLAKPRTPAEADKKRLARDILRSLGRSSSMASLSGGQQEIDGAAQPKAIGNTVNATMDRKPVAVAPEHQGRSINVPSAQTQNGSHVQSIEMHAINAADAVPQVFDNGLSSTALPSHTPVFPMETQPPSQELAELTISESQHERVFVVEDARMPDASTEALEEPEIIELTTPAAEEYRATQVASSSPLSTTFELHPQQAEPFPIEGKVPLFLPSPSPSPPPAGPSHIRPEVDDEVVIIEDSRTSVKSLVADVQAMNVDDVDTPPQVKRGKKRKQMAYVLVPSAPQWVTQAIKKRKKQHGSRQIQNDQALVDEESYAPLEKYVMDQALSKIAESPCRWQNCNAVLNSGENLAIHLLLHTKDIDRKGPFVCRWENCGMKFSSSSKLEAHVERHPKSRLPCSILGCPQHFTTPIDVMQHEVLHQTPGSDVTIPVKSTTQPYTPRLPLSLGPIPDILPSYRVEPRHVRQATISAQRHAVLGPWVLRNIFGPVDLGMKRPNAAVPLRYYSRPSGIPEDLPRPMQDDYDFLIPLSSGVPKSLVLDDLPSTPISQMVQAGLVFFDIAKTKYKTGAVLDNTATGAATNYTASSSVSEVALDHDGQSGSLVADRQGVSSSSVGSIDEVVESDWPKHRNSGEEEAVEKMLL